MTSRSIRFACLVALVLIACDDGERFVDVGDQRDRQLNGDLDGGDGDSGGNAGQGGNMGGGGGSDPNPGMDAQVMLPDGATFDAAALGHDGSISLPDGTYILPDGAVVLPDGAVIDRDTAIDRYQDPEPNVPSCELQSEDDNTFEAEVEIFDEGGYALVPGPTGFGLAYRGNVTGNCSEAIRVLHIPASSGFPEPISPFPTCSRKLTDVSLAAHGEGWQLAWIDNSTNSAEVHALALSPDMVAAEGASDLQLTDEPGALEYRPVVKDVHGRPLAAFVSDAGDQFSISTRFLDHDGEGDNMTVIRPADAQQPQALALSAMGNHNAALAWVGPENNPGVWLQPLDEEGRQSGNPIKLTERVAVSSSVDLAQREDGGGVIYSIEIDGKPQVRFHRLDSEGMPIGDERVILGPPLRAQGASLHAIAGGYAVAYRALPGGSINSPEIRLLFISKEGNLMRDSAGNLPTLRVASATEGASRTSIAVSIEGQVMIAWVDAGSGDHNALKVVRHRLDCGP